MKKSGSTVNGKTGGYTLLEACVAIIIICILIVIAAPIYNQAVEQARLDAAAGNLKTIWAAQRAYWLKENQFAPSLDILADPNVDLINPSLAKYSPDAMYVYRVQLDPIDPNYFTVYATRNNSNVWAGEIYIDQAGQIGGYVSKTGVVLYPFSQE